MSYSKKFFSCCICLIVSLVIIHYNNLDIKLQSLFFDYSTKQWLVSRDNLELKFWFYKLPKILIITYGVCMILWLAKLKIKNQDIQLQKNLLFLILSLILIPLLVATLKHYSPIYCPNHITEFAGGRPFISPLDIFDYDIFFNNNGKCSPAGHASGGFALLSLYFVMPNRKLKSFFLGLALVIGSIMGFYQLAKGVHYLSDTIATLSIAYLICISLEKLLLKNNATHLN